jgi:peptidylprolyl isomerase
MRFLAVLLGAVLLTASVFAQTPAVMEPDADPENTLLLQLKDGVVVIEMRPDLAPNTVRQIKMLVRKHFYDGIVFHRVVVNTLAQAGDPTGTGQSGYGKTLKAEFSNEHHMRGTVSMARADDPDSADSQFFILMKPLPALDHEYTIWGKVIRGMEFVDNIKPGILGDGRVLNPDRIVSMRVEADVLRGEKTKAGHKDTAAPQH